MNESGKVSGGAANRLLIVAVVIAAAAGGAVFYFYSGYVDASEELDRAKKNYDRIKLEAPKIQQLLRALAERRAGGGPRQDPVVYLGTTFTSRGFSNERFTVTPERESTSGGWREKPFKVHFRRRKDDLLDRNKLINAVVFIEKNRPDLKTKSLTLRFSENDLVEATIIFSQFKRD